VYANLGMKRLLLVAHLFPPTPSPGSVRPGYLAHYLPRYGWDVTVLTAGGGEPPFPARVLSTAAPAGVDFQERIRQKVAARIDNPHAPLRRVLRAAKEALLFPDTTAPWIPKALAAADAIMQKERFDAILSTALPPSVHVIAWILSRRYGVPWIADYRDPWAGNFYYNRRFVRKWIEEFLERGMLHRASAITTISEECARRIAGFHRRRVDVVPNAYDPAEWDLIPPAVPERFDLCFTGSMYDGKRNPDMLFEAIAQLRAEQDPAGLEARVHFYGPNSERVADSAQKYGVSLVVRRHGVVPRQRAMSAQRSAAVLLIFLSLDPTTSHEMGSKYLEYLGARRPILAFGPRTSALRSFIEEHGLGWFASDAGEAAAALRALYVQFSSGAFEVHADVGAVPSARDMALRFADLLDSATGLDDRLADITYMRGA
jgi:hypothetical protein